ncbi:hypothetical protein [Sphingomonas sp. PB2P19]|uniref:hypothetical protein n=1 Tax=Sphingomonas rhamnosi TaxID=3096156 RepID=UPI002FC8352D
MGYQSCCRFCGHEVKLPVPAARSAKAARVAEYVLTTVALDEANTLVAAAHQRATGHQAALDLRKAKVATREDTKFARSRISYPKA